MSSDSETQTSASAPDQEDELALIKPKKLSTSSGPKISVHAISSVKLKRISSEKENEFDKKVDTVKEVEEEDHFDPKQKFGVNLRRVQTEKHDPRKEREKSPELIEMEQKFHSLSLSRKSKAAKIPLNENLTRNPIVENLIVDDREPAEQSHLKGIKESNRKRSPSPNIPISKGVESVIKNKETDEKIQRIQKLNVCHATSAMISFDETHVLEMCDTYAIIPAQDSSTAKPDIVASLVVPEKSKETLDNSKHPILADKPDILEPSQIVPETDKALPKVNNEKDQEKAEKITDETTNKEGEHSKVVDLSILSSEVKIETKSINQNDVDTNDVETSRDDTNIEDSSISKLNVISNNRNNNAVSLLKETEDEIVQISSEVSEISATPQVLAITNNNEQTKAVSLYKVETSKITGPMSEGQIDSIVYGKKSLHTQGDDTNGSSNLLEAKPSPEKRTSIHSLHSQISTESDEPLPKLNFLGRDDRLFGNFKNAREDGKIEKSSSSDDSIDQLRDKSLRPRSYTRPDSVNSLEPRSSLVLPEFTVFEEKTEELGLSSPKQDNNLENQDLTHVKEEILQTQSFNENNIQVNENNIKDTHEIVDKSFQFLQSDESYNEKEPGDEDKQKMKIDQHSSVVQEKNLNETPEKYENQTKNGEKEITNSISLIDGKNLKKTLQRQDFNVTDSDEPRDVLIEINKDCYPEENQDNKISEKLKRQNLKNGETISSNSLSDDEKLKMNKSTKRNTFQRQDCLLDISEDTSCDKTSLEKLDVPSTSKNDETINEDSIKNAPKKQIPSESKQHKIEHAQIMTSSEVESCGLKKLDEQDLSDDENVLEKMESEEAEDFFPQFGETECRQKDKSLLSIEDASVRTSGIIGLKAFLEENRTDTALEVKSGISRLGHSPAIEKLKEEIL